MANGTPEATQIPEAKQLYTAWPHLRLAVSQGLRSSPKMAYKIANGIRLGK